MLREKPGQFEGLNPVSAISNSLAKVQIHALGQFSKLMSNISEIPGIDISGPLGDIIDSLKSYK